VRVRLPAEAFKFPEKSLRSGVCSQALCRTSQIYFDGAWMAARTYSRDLLHPGDTIHGPALIGEYSSTTVLPPGCFLEVDCRGNLLITVNPDNEQRASS